RLAPTSCEGCWVVSRRLPARHKALVMSVLESSIHPSSQYPGTLEFSRRRNQGLSGRDFSQSRSSRLMSVGMSKTFPSSTVFEQVNCLVVCLASLQRIL